MCKCFLPKYWKSQLVVLDWLNTLFFFLRSVALALKGAVSVSSHFGNFQHFAIFNIMATFQKLKDMSRKTNMQH